MFKVNFKGVEEVGDYSPVPDGTYILRVQAVNEAKTHKGDPMVKVTLEVKSDGLYTGRKVFHNVTFLAPGSKGAGFSKHWLHVIGQPYEGEVTVQPHKWVGQRLEADVIVESYEYEGKSGERNKLTAIRALETDAATRTADMAQRESEVPF